MLFQKAKHDLSTGGSIRLFKLTSRAQEKILRLMKDAVWGCELAESDLEIVKRKFSEIGLDFEEELLKRGRPVSPNPKSIKTDYGDLAEVIGYYIETEIDGTDPRYVWARNIHNKTVSRVSLPGIDGIAIHLEDLPSTEALRPSESLTICEWKHTEEETIATPSKRSAEFVSEITIAKLVQELKIISKDLKKRGESNRSVRVYSLAIDFEKKSKNVKLKCAILGIENDSSVADLERHFIDHLKSCGWAAECACGDAVEVASVAKLANDIYEHFTH